MYVGVPADQRSRVNNVPPGIARYDPFRAVNLLPPTPAICLLTNVTPKRSNAHHPSHSSAHFLHPPHSSAAGIYYLISRCHGPSFGGSVGIIFYLAQSMAVGPRTSARVCSANARVCAVN